MQKADELRGIRVVTERSGGLTERKTEIVSLYAGECSRLQSSAPESGYTIERRDLKERYQVAVKHGTYRVVPLLELVTPEERARFFKSGRHWQERHGRQDAAATREYRIRFEYKRTTDETHMHGCVARRWIIIRSHTHEPQEGAHRSEIATSEAWYIEAEELERRYPTFDQRLIREAFCYATSGNERVVIDRGSNRPRGLCAKSTSTSVSSRQLPGRVMHKTRIVQQSRITSLTQEVFPASTFELPRGFSQMPVYPSRGTMAKRELTRAIGAWGRAISGGF